MPSLDPLSSLLAPLGDAPGGRKRIFALPPATCAAALGLDGVSISLFHDAVPELIWHDPEDLAGTALEDLQYTVGEGPTWEAGLFGEPVLLPDLQAAPTSRWPTLLPAARTQPVRAVLSLPLNADGPLLGAMTGHRTTPALPDEGLLNAAHQFARLASALLLSPSERTDYTVTDPRPLHRDSLHHAAGALAVRLDIPVDQALARIRAHAHHHNLPLLDVADDVLNHDARPGEETIDS